MTPWCTTNDYPQMIKSWAEDYGYHSLVYLNVFGVFVCFLHYCVYVLHSYSSDWWVCPPCPRTHCLFAMVLCMDWIPICSGILHQTHRSQVVLIIGYVLLAAEVLGLPLWHVSWRGHWLGGLYACVGANDNTISLAGTLTTQSWEKIYNTETLPGQRLHSEVIAKTKHKRT